MRWQFAGVMLLALAASAFAQGVPSRAGREAVVRAISKWDADCDGGERGSWDDMAIAWYTGLTIPLPWPWGGWPDNWVTDGTYSNGNFVDSNVADATRSTFGNDDANDRPDDVDAICLALHGMLTDDGLWAGRVRVDEAGEGNCNTWSGHMALGNNVDNEFTVLSSCFSMSKSTWWDGWIPVFKGVHQIDGFHGIMYIRQSLIDNYYDFAVDSFYVPMSSAWIDNLYDPRLDDNGNPKDQCPTVRGAGLSENGLWIRMDHERYNYVYSDPTNPGWHGVIYIKGCDPSGDDPLPN